MGLQQRKPFRQQGRQTIHQLLRLHHFGEAQIQPIGIGFCTQRQGQGQLQAGQRMETTGERHRQLTAAQRPLQHPHQIEMAQQRHLTGFGKAHPQTPHLLTGGFARRINGGNWRRRHHHVVSQAFAAHAAMAAAIERAIRNHHRLKGPFKVFLQPLLADPRIDVIPGQGFAAALPALLRRQRLQLGPTAQFQLAVTTAQAGRFNRLTPGAMGALDVVEPGIHAGARAPSGFDHRGQAPITTPDEVLHR